MFLAAIIKAGVFIHLILGTLVKVVLDPLALQPLDMSSYF